jgi:MFS family permease
MPAVPLRRNRDFVLYQTGQLLSNVGSQATAIAYPLLVPALTHSAVKAGLVSTARLLPLALFAIPAGLASDRWNRRTLMLLADGLRVVAMGALALVVAGGHASVGLIGAVAFVEGGGSALFSACQAGVLRAVVPAHQLPEAAGTQSGRTAAVQLAGPPAGGALFELARALPFGVDVVSYAFSTLSLLWMRTPFQEERPPHPSSLRARIGEGLAYLWHQPFLRTCALLYGLLNFLSSGLLFSLVVIGRDQGLPGGVVGLLVALFAGAVLLGSVLSPRIRRRLSLRSVLLLEIWAWLGCAAFVVWPNDFVLAAGIVPVGLAIPSTDSVVNGYRIAITPDRLLGRSESVRSAITLSIAGAAPLVAGILLARTTPRWTIGCFAGAAVVLALWGSTTAELRHPPPLPVAP